MGANILPSSSFFFNSTSRRFPSKTLTFLRPPPIHLLRAVNGQDDAPPPPAPLTPEVAAESVEIRFRRGSRRRAREQQPENMESRKKSPPKDWDSMSMSEKALELYVGEKGLLFWLNKFAYASIFIIIGAWILFRFVGPSLGFYQLDAPPLAPTSVFKGS